MTNNTNARLEDAGCLLDDLFSRLCELNAMCGAIQWIALSLAAMICTCYTSAQIAPGQFAVTDRLNEGARLQQQGRLNESIQTLAPLVQSDGIDATVQGKAMLLMGISYQDLGQSRDAQASYEKAIVVFRANPSNARETNAALDDLGSVYRDMGMPAEAKALRKKALLGFEEAGDRNGVARVSNNLAEVCLDQGDRREAGKYLGEALAGMNKGADLDEDDAAAIYSTAGKLALLEGNGSKALSYYQKSLALWTGAHGGNHSLSGRGLILVGNSYVAMGSYSEAILAYRQGLSILKETSGEKAAVYWLGELAYAHALSKTGKNREAAQIQGDARAALASLRGEQCAGCTVNVRALR